MRPVSAHDVARELRRRLPAAGVLKIQKLLYYCKGWSLAWQDDPLFSERVEAWDQGPVVAAVWRDEHHGGSPPQEQELTAARIDVVEYVVKRYGGFTGAELVDMTHAEAPWRDAEHNSEITDEVLRLFFRADAEFVGHQQEVARISTRRDVYGYERDPLSPAIVAATERALRRHAAGQAG